jgi:hypothetical protein
MMFIAIENMGSAYGYKSKNTENKQPADHGGKGQQRSHAKAKEEVFKARRELADAIGFNPKKDESEGSFLFDAKMFAEKRKDTCCYGICGSLTGMLKRVEFECANTRGLKFDTLVFVGHGNAGVMTVGMGCTPLNEYRELTQRKQKNVLDGMNMEKRMINVQNKETWSEQFRIHQDCFKPDRDHDTFHVLFAGCSTGNLTKLSHKHLTNVVAKTLAKLFQCNVNAYGTDKTIENDEILHILTNIETIKGGATGVSGTYVLNERQNINLDWVKRHN